MRVLILSGHNNHDWRTTTPYLQKLLADSGRFDVRVEEEPAGVTAATLANYDLLVVDYQGPRWGEVTEKAVADFVRSGKGLVRGARHAATHSAASIFWGPAHQRTGTHRAGLEGVRRNGRRHLGGRRAERLITLRATCSM